MSEKVNKVEGIRGKPSERGRRDGRNKGKISGT